MARPPSEDHTIALIGIVARASGAAGAGAAGSRSMVGAGAFAFAGGSVGAG